MSKIFPIICLLVCGGLLPDCKSENVQNIQTEISSTPILAQISPEEKNETQIFSAGRADFKGVSFTFNPLIFNELEAEAVAQDWPLQMETDKPGEDFPKHTVFYFKKDLKGNGRLLVIPIENYRQMYAVSNERTKNFDENLSDVQKLIKNKNFRRKGEASILPFWNASQLLVAKIKQLPFENGQGISYLTQYSEDLPMPINNEGLEYIFQGITNDGKTYILAEFSATTAVLPKDYYDYGFEGYNVSLNYAEYEKDVKPYKQYIAKITKRLDAFPSSKFNPALNEFEKIITSLRIEK